jgi:cell division protein FtsB
VQQTAQAPKALMVIATVLIGFLAFTSVFGDRGLISIHKLQAEETRIRTKAEGLEAENARLKDDVRKLTEDDAYLERVARESQGLVKDGETVYRFPPKK